MYIQPQPIIFYTALDETRKANIAVNPHLSRLIGGLRKPA
jgi:hypothetical protein